MTLPHSPRDRIKQLHSLRMRDYAAREMTQDRSYILPLSNGQGKERQKQFAFFLVRRFSTGSDRENTERLTERGGTTGTGTGIWAIERKWLETFLSVGYGWRCANSRGGRQEMARCLGHGNTPPLSHDVGVSRERVQTVSACCSRLHYSS